MNQSTHHTCCSMHALLADGAYTCVRLCKVDMTTGECNLQALGPMLPGPAAAAHCPTHNSSSSSCLQHAPAAAERSAASTAPSGLRRLPSMPPQKPLHQAQSRLATTSLCRPGSGAPLRARRATAGPPWARPVTGRYCFCPTIACLQRLELPCVGLLPKRMCCWRSSELDSSHRSTQAMLGDIYPHA